MVREAVKIIKLVSMVSKGFFTEAMVTHLLLRTACSEVLRPCRSSSISIKP